MGFGGGARRGVRMVEMERGRRLRDHLCSQFEDVCDGSLGGASEHRTWGGKEKVLANMRMRQVVGGPN